MTARPAMAYECKLASGTCVRPDKEPFLNSLKITAYLCMGGSPMAWRNSWTRSGSINNPANNRSASRPLLLVASISHRKAARDACQQVVLSWIDEDIRLAATSGTSYCIPWVSAL
jgi:hypothetical protein